jgi:hypothetical protein
MTKQEFDGYAFSKNTIVIYKGKQYPIYSIEFETGEIGFYCDSQIMEQPCQDIDFVEVTILKTF